MKRLLRQASAQKIEFEILYGFSKERELPTNWKTKNEIAKELAEIIVESDPQKDMYDTIIDIEKSIEESIYNRLSGYTFRNVGFEDDYPESGKNISSVITEIRSDLNKFTFEYVIKDESKAETTRADLLKEISSVFGVMDYSEQDEYLVEINRYYVSFILKLK